MHWHLETLYIMALSLLSDVKNARGYPDTRSEAVIDHNYFLENRRGVREEGLVSLVIIEIKASVCYGFELDYEGVLNSVLA